VGELVGSPADQQRVRGELAAIFETRTAAEWYDLLAAHDCCVEIILEPDELPAHPLHQARGVFFEIQGADGATMRQIRTPVGTPANASPPPRLGEHTRDVLAEYGLDEAKITALT
jgi:alpha-methylacyl-CoA racemase